jgi:hypothetical protein
MPFQEQAQDGKEMSAARRSLVPMVILKSLVAMLVLPVSSAAGQTEIGESVRIIEQRLMLASRMIERMASQDRGCLPRQLEVLQTRFLETIDDQLVKDSNVFFARVMKRYRIRVGNRAGTNDALLKRRFDKKRSALKTFSQSYATLVAERGDEAGKALAKDSFRARVRRADELAGMKRYEEAYAVADGAYHQLLLAMKTVRDRETVEYRLEFSSIDEEFAYEVRRFKSQKMLLEMLLAEKQPSQDSMQLIDSYVAEAGRKYFQAQGLADKGDLENALSTQESAVEELTRAMRVAGIFF